MAEDKKDVVEEEVKPKKKKGKTTLIIVLTVLLLVAGGGGFAAYKFVFATPAPVEEAIKKDQSPAEKLEYIVGTMVELEPFLVNINDGDSSRFLKTKLTLELDNNEVQSEIEKRLAQIRDTILLLLSSKSFEDIRSYDGKFILREEINDQLNSILITGSVKNVYFTELVVQ